MSYIKILTEEIDAMVSKKKISKSIVLQKENDCMTYLNIVTEKMKMYSDMFNVILTDICSRLTSDFPHDKFIAEYCKALKEHMKQFPIEPISSFLLYIYTNEQYRNAIMNEEDGFFLDDKNHKKLISGNKEKMIALFQFKSHWTRFNELQKTYIKSATKIMLEIAEQYIITKDNGNKIAKLSCKLLDCKIY